MICPRFAALFAAALFESQRQGLLGILQWILALSVEHEQTHIVCAHALSFFSIVYFRPMLTILSFCLHLLVVLHQLQNTEWDTVELSLFPLAFDAGISLCADMDECTKLCMLVCLTGIFLFRKSRLLNVYILFYIHFRTNAYCEYRSHYFLQSV